MWFIIAVSAFFLLAVAALIDKYLLTKGKIVPVAFAFYICFGGGLLTSFLVLFEPQFNYYPINYLTTLLLGGTTLFFGYYFMFWVTARAEVSKSNPLIVCFIPVVVFFLSLFLGLELVSFRKMIGVFLVVGGGYLLSQVGSARARLDGKSWLLVILAGLMLGISNVFTKIAYNHLSFLTAFVWLRWVSLLAALFFVLFSGQLGKVLFNNKEKGQNKSKQPWLPFIIGQAAGSLGVIFLQYAIKLGNLILVNALNGLQFFFVILLVYYLSRFYPKILKEDISPAYFSRKVLWSVILAVGVIFILI